MHAIKVIMVIVSILSLAGASCGAAAGPIPPYILSSLPMDSRIPSKVLLDLLSAGGQSRVILMNEELGYIFIKTSSEIGKCLIFIPKEIEAAPDYMYTQIVKNTIDPVATLVKAGWKTINFDELPSELKTVLSTIGASTTWSSFVGEFLMAVSKLGTGMFTPLFMIIPTTIEDPFEIYTIT